MKNKLLVFILFCFSGTMFAQVTIDYEKKIITIDATMPINYESEIDFSQCQCTDCIFVYEITILKDYSLSIARNTALQSALNIETKNIVDTTKLTYKGKISFNKNTENIFTVYKGEEKFTYKFKTKSLKSWTTTFGANSVIFVDRSRYISSEKEGIRSVSKVNDNQMMDVIPSIMFTYMNNQEDYSTGFTGGIGTNFEIITIFSGLSLGIGQNIILTGGVGISKQMRPDNSYSQGQIIDSSLTNENLNESQYRINPFLGISFRLDKNPFGKKTE